MMKAQTISFISIFLVAFTMGSSSTLYGDIVGDAWCDVYDPANPSFEFPIRYALDAEVYTIELISTLPTPIPKPLLQIPTEFQKIAGDVMEARSWSLVATLPTPIPNPPSSLPIPIPGPNTAVAAQDRALHRVEHLGEKIDQVYGQGWITEEEFNDLTTIQVSLQSLIESLPIPIP